MSKGEDVLDNWEEMDEVNLNSKIDKLKQEAARMNTSPLGESAAQQQQQQPMNGKPMKILMMDDDYRSQQYGPIEPTVKILRRPAHERSDKSAQDAKPKVPVKTLQQREQEYAQARLRILGSARSPEETTTSPASSQNTSSSDRVNSMNGTTSNTNMLYRKQLNQQQQQQQLQLQLQQQQHNDGGSSSYGMMSIQLPASADGVIRLPRGPDGSTGFTVRR